VRVDDALLDLLEQPREGLLGVGVDELVVLQLADGARGIGRKVIERLAALARHPRENAMRALIVGALQALLDAPALEAQDVVQLLLDVLEHVVQAEPLQLLLATPAQLLHHLLEAGETAALAVPPALAEQAPQRCLEIPAVKHVLAQPVEERGGVVTERVLRAIPDREAMSLAPGVRGGVARW